MSNTNNNSIRSNSSQHRPSSPQHNDSNAVQQQTAGTASRTPQTPEEKVFQNAYILSRIIEQSDSPSIASKNLRTVTKASRQASIITQQGQSLKEFTARDLLNAFSQDPKTRNNSSLRNYLQKAPKDCPLPDIDITIFPSDLNYDDILFLLRKLQSSDNTSPIKAVIEVNNPSELQSLIDNRLPLLQENHSLFRAISIKVVSTFQLQYRIATLAQRLQYTTASQITPTIKHFPLRISLNIPTLNEFLATDFSTLPDNLQITQLTIDNKRDSLNKETLTKAQNPQFQQQLNNLKHITALKLQIVIAEDATLTIPASVTKFTTHNTEGTLEFAPDSQCSQLSINFILRSGTVTLPPSVTALDIETIHGTLLFAPDSQYSELYLGEIGSSCSLTLPASVTTLDTKIIEGTLQFAPNSQCAALSIDVLREGSTVTIPATITRLSIEIIYGTLLFAPGSQCSELSLYHIYRPATIPSSVKILTINKTTYTGQDLLDLRSGETSLRVSLFNNNNHLFMQV